MMNYRVIIVLFLVHMAGPSRWAALVLSLLTWLPKKRNQISVVTLRRLKVTFLYLLIQGPAAAAAIY